MGEEDRKDVREGAQAREGATETSWPDKSSQRQCARNQATPPDPEALALTALGWILADEARIDRFLGVTGIAPHELASALGNRLWLAGVLRYLEQNEADLIVCADAIHCRPEALVDARAHLESSPKVILAKG